MKTMGKRILALALTLCLVLALGTTAHAAEAPTQITASVSGSPKAGDTISEITLTADKGAFASSLEQASTLFTINGGGAGIVGANVQTAERQSETVVKLTVDSCTPTKAGSFTVDIEKGAFEGTQPADKLTSTAISVTAADKPTLSATSRNLTAGTAGGTIELSITSNDNEFATDNNNTNYEVDGLSVTNVSASGTTATLTVSGTPSAGGDVTVTVKPAGFKYQPGESATVQANVAYPTVSSVKVSGGPLTVGQQGSITVSIEGSEFETSPVNTSFTLSGCGVANPDSVTGSGKTATLSVTPKSSGSITVTNIGTEAFKYKPSGAVSSDITGSVTVNAPTVTASASGELTQGNGGNITVKITSSNDTFKSGLSKTDAGLFTVKVADSESLTATEITGGGSDTATLTVPAPTTTGTVSVTINKSAFTTEAEANVTAKSTAKVSSPTVTTITAALEDGTLTAGVDAGSAKIKLTADGTANFKNSLNTTDNITLGGAGVSGLLFSAEGSGKTATLTLTGTPTQAGDITITVNESAFTYAPGSVPSVTGTVTVSAPTGSVSAALEGGTLTAGTAAGDTKIKLTATGTLNFKNSQEKEYFTLEKGTGDIGSLAVSEATYSSSDKSVTLTLTGTPKAGGDFTVKVKQDAFVAKTQDPTDITATGSLTIGYPTIKLTADRDHIAEGDTVTTITLTATGSPFNEISAKDGFTLNGEGATGVELQSVQAAAGTYTVTLTLSGTTSREGDFTITVPKTAFQYQPETDPKVTITVGEPEGTITGTQNGKLYVGTPADGVTITVTITDSKGLHFDPSASTDAFTLGGTGSPELTVKSVAISGDTATLTLSGTPTTAGDFTITAETSAFKPTPKQTKAVTGEFTVGDPNVALTVSDNTLQAGAENGTVTLTLTGSKFVSALTDMVTLVPGEDYKNDNLTIDVKRVDDTTVTVTVNGVPSVMGKISFEFKTDAFTPAPTAAVTVAVDVAKGEQAAEAEANPGAPGIGFTAPLDQLAAAVLTPDEQALYEKGAEVKIELVESVGAQIPQTDKTAVEAASGDYTVGEYLDVSLVKSVNGVTDDITETKTPIQVVFTIPTDLRAANRSFAVIRVHDGTATLLEPVASTAETITVESSLFSTYAIVYREVVPTPTETPAATETPAPTEAPATPTEAPVEPTAAPVEPTEAPDATEAPEATDAPAEPTATPAGTEAPKAPDTGDGSMPGLWMGLLAVCAAGLVLTLIQLRRRSRG